MSRTITAYTDEEKRLAAVELLREQYGIETYDDFAVLCRQIAQATDFMRYDNNAPMDHEEKKNLEHLSSLMMMASDMFINCDSYYRR